MLQLEASSIRLHHIPARMEPDLVITAAKRQSLTLPRARARAFFALVDNLLTDLSEPRAIEIPTVTTKSLQVLYDISSEIVADLAERPDTRKRLGHQKRAAKFLGCFLLDVLPDKRDDSLILANIIKHAPPSLYELCAPKSANFDAVVAAATAGRPQVLVEVVSLGGLVNVDCYRYLGNAAMEQFSVAHGSPEHEECFRILCEHDMAFPEFAIGRAVSACDVPRVKYLLGLGVKYISNASDRASSIRALLDVVSLSDEAHEVAIRDDDPELHRLLAERGIPPNVDHLALAIEDDNEASVHALLDLGVRLKAGDCGLRGARLFGVASQRGLGACDMEDWRLDDVKSTTDALKCGFDWRDIADLAIRRDRYIPLEYLFNRLEPAHVDAVIARRGQHCIDFLLRKHVPMTRQNLLDIAAHGTESQVLKVLPEMVATYGLDVLDDIPPAALARIGMQRVLQQFAQSGCLEALRALWTPAFDRPSVVDMHLTESNVDCLMFLLEQGTRVCVDDVASIQRLGIIIPQGFMVIPRLRGAAVIVPRDDA